VSRFLGPEWFDGLEARLADRLDGLDADVTLQCVIGGGPDGEVKCYAVVEDQRMAEAGL